MAVELEMLYREIKPNYDVRLCTASCFQKTISWLHMVEDVEFVPLLHGDELVFSSGLKYTSEEWLRKLVDILNDAHAGGLIVSLREGKTFSREILDYCNAIKFPLFSSSWDTPYVDIMHIFSVILLQNEQREINLTAALKNAIYYPQSEELYQSHFESHGFFRDMKYRVIILSCHTYDTENGNERMEQIEKALRFAMKNGIMYEEKGRLTILAAGYRTKDVYREFQQLCRQDSNIYVGIGTVVNRMKDIYISYEKAYMAYQLTKTAIPKNLLDYEGLGVYKILADVKEPEIYPAFVQETLGELLKYDRENGTEYIKILEAYFENECNIINTAAALYCHKNTLAYKLNKIKDILRYDILSNENRTKIMLSFYIRKIEGETED